MYVCISSLLIKPELRSKIGAIDVNQLYSALLILISIILYQNTKTINWCMSSRREVLIRILALLQRKTLIETKNRALECLKCLKWHYLTVRSMKNVAVLTEDGEFALFFRPHPRGFDSSRVPNPGDLPSKAKKMLMPGGQPGAGLGAGRID